MENPADEQPAIADFSNSPEFQEAVAKAVAQHIGTIANLKDSNQETSQMDWRQFLNGFEKLTEALNSREAGYVKPLSREEAERRDEGRVAFESLIIKAKDAVQKHGRQNAIDMGLVPHYIVGKNGFYGSTAAGGVTFEEGQQIYLTTAPPEDFKAVNTAAAEIMNAQMQWLGGPTRPIAEIVSDAERMMRPNARAFDPPVKNADDAILIPDAPIVNLQPRHIAGTIVANPLANASPASNMAAEGPFFAE